MNNGDAAVLKGFADVAMNVQESNKVPQHGSFVSGNWQVIKDRKFTGWS
ncbi:hypothetical protein [Arthrobacter sp. ok362]|nr:hypothetical protein [Arthrobacter sp. ok362]SDL53790.1 hypothetical protein SAMN04487913_110177 [Arthrobacter sp. ok362]